MTTERIILVGLRGTGKTTVGRKLAARLGWEFLDADPLLEAQAGCSIAEIFAREGEAGFREREAALLADLLTRDRVVLATGGGAILREDTRNRLRAAGLCVWLTGDPELLAERLAADPSSPERRPALTDLAAREEIIWLARCREPYYREVAHRQIATDQLSPDDIVSAILTP